MDLKHEFLRSIFHELNIPFRLRKNPANRHFSIIQEQLCIGLKFYILYRSDTHVAYHLSYFTTCVICEFARKDYHTQSNLRFRAQLRNVIAGQSIYANVIGRSSRRQSAVSELSDLIYEFLRVFRLLSSAFSDDNTGYLILLEFISGLKPF